MQNSHNKSQVNITINFLAFVWYFTYTFFFSEAVPPLIVCVKLDMTGGDFEEILVNSDWKEGRDYILFS